MNFLLSVGTSDKCCMLLYISVYDASFAIDCENLKKKKRYQKHGEFVYLFHNNLYIVQGETNFNTILSQRNN